MNNDLKTALSLFQNFKLDESLQLLEKIVESDSDNVEALLMIGKIHSRTQNYGVAMNYFHKVLELKPNEIEAKTNMQLIKNILQLSNNFYFENTYTDDDLYEPKD